MATRESGWQPADMLDALERLPDLLDEAAREHAEAIMDVAKDYGHIRRLPRTVERAGPSQYTVVDPGIQMTWLRGKVIPLRLAGGVIFRTASERSLAAGGWWYPGRTEPMADADKDARVRAVVQAALERIAAALRR